MPAPERLTDGGADIVADEAGPLDPDLLRVYRPIIARAGGAAGGPSVLG